MANVAKVNETRRRFMAHFAGIGLGATLVPGVLWARMQDAGVQKVTLEMVTDALKLSGIEVAEDERKTMVDSANTNLERYVDLHKTHIPNDVSPPFHFSAIVPGIEVNKARLPFRLSVAPPVKRPANLEDVAFWPLRHLAELVRTKQVKSVELTQMYLTRLHRYNPKLNFVVTFLDDVGMEQAKKADAEIAAGKYKGPLHGIPWGAKDIISVKGYKTTWGSPAFKDQMFDYDASVIELLREAGAVLVAKVATGELAGGDQWFGGTTRNPWEPTQGSSGSSAGPASATAAGCIAFGIGSETGGSILSPSARCGLAGLRPTFGRVSRYGVMALSWTQDRLGPLCRYAEDTAIVMQAIAKPDGRDMSVSEIPFNWDATFDIKRLKVGYVKESFDNLKDPAARANSQKVLDTLKSLGVSNFIPVEIPDLPYQFGGLGVESTVFFDEMSRQGKMKLARGGGRNAPRLIPAVEYLQSQRTRMMMMTELAKATAGVDVYIVASDVQVVAPVAPAGTPPPPPRPANAPTGPQSAAQRHSNMANLACYPAMNIPNGFSAAGTPTNVTFFGRPFGEMSIIALGKAYQDVARFHLKKPAKMEG